MNERRAIRSDHLYFSLWKVAFEILLNVIFSVSIYQTYHTNKSNTETTGQLIGWQKYNSNISNSELNFFCFSKNYMKLLVPTF